MSKYYRRERIAELMQQISELNVLLENENLNKLMKGLRQRKKKGVPEQELLGEAEQALNLIQAHADLAIAKAKLSALQGE